MILERAIYSWANGPEIEKNQTRRNKLNFTFRLREKGWQTTEMPDITIIIMNIKLQLPVHQHLDRVQLERTLGIREMFPYWSGSRMPRLPTWLKMINAAAQSQNNDSQQLNGRGAERSRLRVRDWRNEGEEEEEEEEKTNKKRKTSSGWLIPSGCLSDVMPTQVGYLQETRSAARPPCLPGITK